MTAWKAYVNPHNVLCSPCARNLPVLAFYSSKPLSRLLHEHRYSNLILHISLQHVLWAGLKTSPLHARVHYHLIMLWSRLGIVELCAKILQIMRNDFKDYARTFCQLRAPFSIQISINQERK